MNEHDFLLIEVLSLLTGIIICIIWTFFSIIYSIRFTPLTLIFFLVILLFSIIVSMYAYFKRKIYIYKMKQALEEK